MSDWNQAEAPHKWAPPSCSGTRRKLVEWVQTPWFCPDCGQRDMWQEGDDGSDYYHDCSVTCGACGYVMCCVAKVDFTPKLPKPAEDAA